jgi:hypothetical protein
MNAAVLAVRRVGRVSDRKFFQDPRNVPGVKSQKRSRMTYQELLYT